MGGTLQVHQMTTNTELPIGSGEYSVTASICIKVFARYIQQAVEPSGLVMVFQISTTG